MSVALAQESVDARAVAINPPLDIALLGCGTVGSAFAALAQCPGPDRGVRITHALVRDLRRSRPTLHAGVERIADGREALAAAPDVLVELLGGIEPARTLVVEALHRRIPVVTANKSLLAAHGAELRALSASTATPLLYEAAVIAGVPFLGTFARRHQAARITGFSGIANGTSNYVLTRARDERCGISPALADAQRLGLAEPDPSNDIDGIDAAEKLVVLLQHFAASSVQASAVEVDGIRRIAAADLDQARTLGGTIKPVIFADWRDSLRAFAGPAFVASTHVLAAVDGAENALVLNGRHGRLLFRGPGAGPDVTAATVMDDVHEAVRAGAAREAQVVQAVSPQTPETPWFLRLAAPKLPPSVDVADLLASHGLFLQRTDRRSVGGLESFAALSLASTRPRIERALGALRAAASCDTFLCRVLED